MEAAAWHDDHAEPIWGGYVLLRVNSVAFCTRGTAGLHQIVFLDYTFSKCFPQATWKIYVDMRGNSDCYRALSLTTPDNITDDPSCRFQSCISTDETSTTSLHWLEPFQYDDYLVKWSTNMNQSMQDQIGYKLQVSEMELLLPFSSMAVHVPFLSHWMFLMYIWVASSQTDK
ncbi:hypothetical protein ACQ4PT_029329 [Festuca glaucescens]